MQLILTFLSVFIPALIQLSYLSYASHEIPIKLFGNYSFIVVLVFSFTQLSMAMPIQAFVRFYNSKNNKKTLINMYMTIVVIISLFGLLYFLIFYFIYGERFTYISYFASALSVFFICAFSLGSQVLLLNFERGKFLICKVLEASSRFLIPILFFYNFKTIDSLLIGLLLGYFISFVFIYWNRTDFKFTLSIANTKEHAKYAYPILFSSIASLIISLSDRYFVDYFMSSDSLGHYSLMYQFASFAQILGVAFSIYVVPIIMRKFEKNESSALLILNGYIKLFFLLLVFVFLLLFLIPEVVYKIFLSDIFNTADNKTVFYLIMAGVFFSVFQTAMSLYFVLIKRLDVHAKLFFIAALLNFLANFYIGKYGLLAASLSTFMSYLIMTILVYIWLKINFKDIVNYKEIISAE